MSDAGKGDNVSKRTNYEKFWENYPKRWKSLEESDDSVDEWAKVYQQDIEEDSSDED